MVSIQRVFVMICVMAASARAGVIEAHGIELEVPADWTVTTGKTSTTIMPAKRSGRGIEIIEANAPLTVAFVRQVMKAAKMTDGDVREGTRNGAKAIGVLGKVPVAGGATVDVEMIAIENAARHTVLLTSYVTSDADPALRAANQKLLLSARLVGPKLALVYKKARRKDLVGYPADVVKLIASTGATLDKQVRLPRPLPIVVDECGAINAVYSSRDHAITMCHELWDSTFALFRLAGYDVEAAHRLAKDTVMFAFFHEFGHALVDELDLATSGSTEDTVDELATIFFGKAKDVGELAAYGGLQWLDTIVRQPQTTNQFYYAHAFDDDHRLSIACLLYASDPQRHATLMKILKIPDHRLARCLGEETARRKAWDSLLAPHLRKPSSP